MRTQHKNEITNTCTCMDYDDDTGADIPAEYCFGDCWDFALEQFAYEAQVIMENNETGWWKVTDLAFWDGNHSGYFHATKVSDILRGMTVRSEWIMRYTAFPDRVEYSLSHHDSMGSATTLTAVTEEMREELGLY